MFLRIRNQRGQGLIEYLIIVALMSVAAIAIVRVVSQNLNARFTEVAYALQGNKKSISTDAIDASVYQKKDLGNFIDGVGSAGKGGGSGSSGSGSGGGSRSGAGGSGGGGGFTSGFGGGAGGQ